MDVRIESAHLNFILTALLYLFSFNSINAQQKKISAREFNSFYENGTLREKGQIVGEKKSGTWVSYSISGKPQRLFHFLNGLKSGKFAEWDINGNLTREGQFCNSEKCGIEYVYENQKIVIKITWLNSLAGQRKEENYDNNGVIRNAGFYKLNYKDSSWSYFTEEGKLSAIENYQNGKRNGAQKRFYPGGSISEFAEYKNGLKHGIRLLFTENGDTTLFGTYSNDLRNGFFVEQTTLQLAELSNDLKSYCVKGNYINDTKDGTFQLFYSKNKKACSEFYRDGKLNGNRELFYENGNLFFECTYEDNKKTGQETFYYPNGKLKKRTDYKNGIMQGEQIYYYENGVISERAVFESGKLIAFNRFNPKGKVVK